MVELHTCLCCLEDVPPCQEMILGWCNECVSHNPVTQRCLVWAQQNNLSWDDTLDLIRKKFLAKWN